MNRVTPQCAAIRRAIPCEDPAIRKIVKGVCDLAHKTGHPVQAVVRTDVCGIRITATPVNSSRVNVQFSKGVRSPSAPL